MARTIENRLTDLAVDRQEAVRRMYDLFPSIEERRRAFNNGNFYKKGLHVRMGEMWVFYQKRLR